jgi:hypothetical protein
MVENEWWQYTSDYSCLASEANAGSKGTAAQTTNLQCGQHQQHTITLHAT